jgi:hypothetical protein
MSASEATRPVKLQVNTSGAWKDVVRFDAGDDAAAAKVMEAAATLGEINAGGVTFRIASDETHPFVLSRWSKTNGWSEAKDWS